MSSRKFAKQQSEKKKDGQTEKSREKSTDNFFIKSRNNKTDKFSGLKNKSFKTKEKQNRSSENTNESKTAKPFDKKAWRYKRYSLKYKLDQWKDLRKTEALHNYKKSMNKNESNEPSFYDKYNLFEDEDIQEKTSETRQKETSDLCNYMASNEEKKEPAGRKRKRSFQGSGTDEEAKLKHMEILNKKKEREVALKEYKRKKIEKFKKLNKKTKKGQPVMKGRLEVLLEEIQNMVKS